MEYIDLYLLATEMAGQLGSKYTNEAGHRRKLREYMEANDWFRRNAPII